MSIQFACPGCGQPIEVDAEFAGKAATCPYCRRVATVPSESTYDPGQSAAARPAGGLSLPPAPPRPASYSPGEWAAPPPPASANRDAARAAAARMYGNFALICTVLTILLMGSAMALLLIELRPLMAAQAGSQPASMQDAMKVQQGLMREAQSKPMVMVGSAMSLGAMFTTAVGVILAIVSLIQSRRGNWRAIVSLLICGGFVLCICGSILMSALLMPAAA